MTDSPYDPGAYTVAEVQEYVTANPAELDAVRAAEAAGKARVTLLDWLDAPWAEQPATTDESTDRGGTVVDAGGRPVTDDGGRVRNHDDVDQP